MSHEDDEWAIVEETLMLAFPDTERNRWDAESSMRSYRIIIGDVPPAAVLVALRRLALESEGKWRPSAGDILRVLNEDPERPTFEDMIAALKAACKYPAGGRREARAQREHALIAGFIVPRLERLVMLRLDDPEYGELRRKELRMEWDAFVEAQEGRERHLLAGGRRNELGRLEPLRALGLTPPAGELEAGDG
ncbi:MAG TPA: hypothetical protein VF192_01150 [Longimicrobiales bacterium]